MDNAFDQAVDRLLAASRALDQAVWAEPRNPDLVAAARAELEAAQIAHSAAIAALQRANRELKTELTDLESTNCELNDLRQAMRDLRGMLENAASDAESRRQGIRIPGGGWYHQGERDAYRTALRMLEDVRERENV